MHKAGKTSRTGLPGTFHQLPKSRGCADTPQAALEVSQIISSTRPVSSAYLLCLCREATPMLSARNKVTLNHFPPAEQPYCDSLHSESPKHLSLCKTEPQTPGKSTQALCRHRGDAASPSGMQWSNRPGARLFSVGDRGRQSWRCFIHMVPTPGWGWR